MEAKESLKLEVWRTAISSQLASLNTNETFEFVDGLAKTPKKPISTRIILKKKLNYKAEIERYKERFVAYGFRQRPVIDFHKLPKLLVSTDTVLLTLAVFRGHMTMRPLNVMTAFLESKVHEELYMTLLKGIGLLKGCLRVSSGTQIQVCERLLKSLYGMK